MHLRALLLLLTPALVVGCAPNAGGGGGGGDDDDDACVSPYPDGGVEPMELGEVISPYSWPTALQVGGAGSAPLDLASVPCASSDDIDWSPFDVLLFVSIPAW